MTKRLSTRVVARVARRGRELGQTSAEYALVLLVAATIAVLAMGWAARTGKVAALLDAVFDLVLEKAS